MYSIVDEQIFNVIDALNPQLIANLTQKAVENVAYR